MKKASLNRYFPYVFMLAVIIVFWHKLIFPFSAILNPDYGLSDPLHIWLPLKYEYANHLKDFSLPIWNFEAGAGYPIHAEITDAFYIPNLLLFFVLPFEAAVSISYLVTFTLAAFGMYCLLLTLRLGRPAALFGGICFAFSASIALRGHHPQIAQAAALIPWSYYFLYQTFAKKKPLYFSLAAVSLNQMLLSYPQIFVYNLTFIFLTVILSSKSLLAFIKKSTILLAMLILAASLSAIQIIPTLEIIDQSQRSSGINPKTILENYPYQPKNLASFLDPYILGNASKGTYNGTDFQNNGIFWENTAYIGLPAILLAAVSTLALFFKNSIRKLYLLLFTLTAIAVALALGAISPLHILFSVPPLNFFRIPARFIIFAQIFLIIISAITINALLSHTRKKIRPLIFASLLLVVIWDFYSKWSSYNLTGEIRNWTQKPQLAQKIPITKNFRIYSINPYRIWNDVFTKYGWTEKESFYLFFLNALEPNYNFFQESNTLAGYQVLPSKRQVFLNDMIKARTVESDENIEITKTAGALLNYYGVKYIVTTKELNSPNYIKIDEVAKNQYRYYLYENKNVQQIISVYYGFKTATTISDIAKAISQYDLQQELIIENEFQPKFPEKGSFTVYNFQQTKNGLFVEVDTTKSGLLSVAYSYSPGWSAAVNGKKAKINPANINSMYVEIPAGKSKVEMSYRPKFYKAALTVTSSAAIVAALLIIVRPKQLSSLLKSSKKH